LLFAQREAIDDGLQTLAGSVGRGHHWR
jgi:hypothetical protein